MILSVGAWAAGSAARLTRTFTSPRSSSNSAMSFSIRNSMSSLSSFWFMLVSGHDFSCRHSLLQRDQFLGRGREHFATALGDHNHVFDADPALARQVDS